MSDQRITTADQVAADSVPPMVKRAADAVQSAIANRPANMIHARDMDYPPVSALMAIHIARAVLSSIREPTREMCMEVYGTELDVRSRDDQAERVVADLWRDMIAQALGEKP